MPSDLLQLEVLSKVILNTIFVSIPEETFVILFALALLCIFDFLSYENVYETGEKLKKSDIIKASIPVLVPSIISGILKCAGVSYLISFTILVLALILSILVVYGLWRNVKDICETIIYIGIAITIVYTLESMYIPLILYSTGKTMVEINNMVFYNFLMFLPERIVETFIIVFVLSRKVTILKANLIRPIINNKVLLSITMVTVIGNVGLMGVLYNIFYSGILENLSFALKISSIVLSFSVPILSISGLLWGIYYSENKKAIVIEAIESHIEDIKKIYEGSKDDKKANSILVNLQQIQTEVRGLKNEE